MKNFKGKVVQFLRDEEGLELAEYAVAGSLIVLAVVTAFTGLGTAIAGAITKITGHIT
ncbi:Flp family type IVb pilin [Marinobacter orientalis]|uniref:Flp family type IVb pilin n=1 Tax=Marinobacter orientalis TaxID=1928859 RepID=A0A7Y0RBC1_9GAMM|nr:Flp family type IVb pilin [Marinobacter orientalis]NMT63089.1 Flp family type IVb pilin [Marinobacter orientalis]TGX51749.1 Flp family type IVb pilin [Marinobacter orientalis]